MWDARDGRRSVKNLHGPHVCGDSIDFLSTTDLPRLVIGSWRKSKSITIWDSKADRIEDCESQESHDSNLIYGLQVINRSSSKQLCITVGCSPNQVRICDVENNFNTSGLQLTGDRTASCVCQGYEGNDSHIFVGNGNMITRFAL
ncbi:MAG: hypothetical protein MHMPM18_002856 [Marteilia pararefringens]